MDSVQPKKVKYYFFNVFFFFFQYIDFMIFFWIANNCGLSYDGSSLTPNENTQINGWIFPKLSLWVYDFVMKD